MTSTAHSSRSGAFSVVEVLVVIALVAVLAAVVTVPLLGTRDRADFASRTAEAGRLNAALQRVAAEGRRPPPGADAASVAAFLRTDPGADWAAFAGSTGRGVDAQWNPVVHTADDRQARLVWTGEAFVTARTGSGLRPAPRGTTAPPLPPPADPEVQGAGYAPGSPWLWDAVVETGPDRPEDPLRPAPNLRLQRGFIPINGPLTVTSPGNIVFLLISDLAGDLVLQFDGITRRGYGTVLALVHPAVAGDERDLWIIGEREHPDPAARGRLAFPVHLRLTPTCVLSMEVTPETIDVPEDETVAVEIPWQARWSDGPVESGVLNLPLPWLAPGGQQLTLPVRHTHAGQVAEGTLHVRHAPATAPFTWLAAITRGSLPWTGLHWQLTSLDTGQVLAAQHLPLVDPPGALPGASTDLELTARLPTGSWRLTATLHDTIGPATTVTQSVEVGP